MFSLSLFNPPPRRRRRPWPAVTLLLGGLLALAIPLAAIASPGDTTESALPAIEGSASYRERIALPPQAVLEATLEDVSLADAPAREIGRTRLPRPAGPPFRFRIPYDPAKVEAGHIYNVRVRILVDDALWFISDHAHRVLARAGDQHVDIPLKMMRREEAARPAPAGGAAAGLLKLPATFRGDLPCADCPGIRHHLDLWPDGTYHLRREWLDRKLTRDELGRWMIASPGRILRLRGGESALSFAIPDEHRLRLLDTQGQAIESAQPLDLTSDGQLQPTDLTLLMGGEMTYLADAARFTECLTGRGYPIAPEADARALEQAYLRQAASPGAPLYVTLEGTLTPRPKMEGPGQEPSLVVNRFVGAWPNQNCSRSKADAELTNTHWRIVRLDGQPIGVAEGRREPHLQLRVKDGKPGYVATVGCNRLIGGYMQTADGLSFGRPASTRMACPPELRQREQTLAAALERTAQVRILGNALVLRDAKGTETAALEAVHF